MPSKEPGKEMMEFIIDGWVEKNGSFYVDHVICLF